MGFRSTFKILAGALIVSSTSLALADSANTQGEALNSLRSEIAQLRQSNQMLQEQVGQLRDAQGENWLNERRAEEVKSLVREVLADADTRASLLEGGLSAGHNGKNFFLASEDGSFLLKIKGQIQFRYVANWRDEEALPAINTIDNQEAGFTIRRTKINFSGHVASPKLGYEIQLAVSRSSNTVSADKIKISYKINDNWGIWFGEDKAPFLREELISSSRQLAVERSYVNEIFTLDKVQGVALTYSSDMIKATVMVNDGMGSGDGSGFQNPLTTSRTFDATETARTGITKDFDDDASDFAITGRIDIMLAGSWSQWKDFTAWDGEDMAIFIGGAFHWEEGETGDADAVSARILNNDFFMWTVDASIEVQRFNAFVAVVGMHTDNETDYGPAGTIKDFDMMGFVAQAGYQIPFSGNIVEPFVRYEHINFDGAITEASALTGVNHDDDSLDMITVGANVYFNKHASKFTLDMVYAFDAVPFSVSGTGILADSFTAGTNTSGGQIVLRGQFQLLF